MTGGVLYRPVSLTKISLTKKAGDLTALRFRRLHLTQNLVARLGRGTWPGPFTPRGAGGLRNPERDPDRAMRQQLTVSQLSLACD